MFKIFALLVVFQLKHFLADYPFQTPYMLQKFKLRGWVKPLAAHAGVHALLTLMIAIWFSRFAILLALFDFIVHFAMDRVKASPNLLGRYRALSAGEFPTATDEQRAGNRYFWWALGLDQMVHHLTHYWIIFFLV